MSNEAPDPQTLLENGRQNNVDSTAYDGPRPANLSFDPGDLYCYLEASRAPDSGIEEIISLFERRFHRLPALAKQEIRRKTMIPRSATETDEVGAEHDAVVAESPENPVSAFAATYLQHYMNRGATPPLVDQAVNPTVTAAELATREQNTTTTADSAHGLTIPGIATVATLGYRTGRALKHGATAAWHRVKQPTGGTPSPSTEPAVNTRDE